MGNLAVHLFYRTINAEKGLLCERAFLDRKEGPVRSLESKRPLNAFDVVGFSVSFEKDVLGVIKALNASRIPVRREERKGVYPLIIAGGVVPSLNPDPLLPIFDLILMGEWEGLPEFLNWLREKKLSGADKEEVLKLAPEVFPQIMDPNQPKVKPGDKSRAEILWHERPSFTAIKTKDSEFADTFLIELVRGCPSGCRFCAVSFLYPFRERKAQDTLDMVKEYGGDFRRVGLVGAGLTFHRELNVIVDSLLSMGKEVTFSSLRIDKIDDTFMELLPKTGVKSISIAPEAGKEEMRFSLGKRMDDGTIIRFVEMLPEEVSKLRLYFMIGLPGETEKDIEAIIELAKRVKGVAGRRLVSLSVSPFVPKPGTPMEDCPMDTLENLKKKRKQIEKALSPTMPVHFESPKWSIFQGLVSLGDRTIFPFLETLAKEEANFLRIWKNYGFDPESILHRPGRNKPWRLTGFA